MVQLYAGLELSYSRSSEAYHRSPPCADFGPAAADGVVGGGTACTGIVVLGDFDFNPACSRIRSHLTGPVGSSQ